MKAHRPLLALAAVGLAATVASPHAAREFPHLAHQGLFPLCTGCHAGVPTGDSATANPQRVQCEGCHDEDPVVLDEFYAGAGEERASNVRFDHPTHDLALADTDTLDCTSCHVEPGSPRMAVVSARPARCLTCHTHEAASHYGDADCGTCHIPLASTAFNARRVRALPVPDDHVDGLFLRNGHGRLAAAEPERCSTCHTRERCTSCHVVPAGVREIEALPPAGAALELPGFPAHYFTPTTHLDAEGWLGAHGGAASAELRECSTCHTRNDCTVCHTVVPPPAVERLPTRQSSQAPGVLLSRRAPESHDAVGFTAEHANLGATTGDTCAACHSRRFCEDCHNAAADPTFHPVDFVLRHATDAYGGRLECQNCHDVGIFCRDCHIQNGMGSVAALGPGFHDTQASWLLRHGQAARQSLETCTTCHAQQDCLQCHAQTGPFRVNPHGPDFDAERMHEKNSVICTACHLGNPLGGSNP